METFFNRLFGLFTLINTVAVLRYFWKHRDLFDG